MLKCLKRTIKNFTLRSDLFAAPATLRYAGQSNYESIFGGILSIALVIAFAVIFYSSFVDVLNKVIISAQIDIQTDPSNVQVIEDLQFGIGISGVDFSSSQRYFIIDLVHISIPFGQGSTETHIQLASCNKSDWENIGEHFDTLFDVHEMEKMLCPISGEHIELEGYKGSQLWQYMQVRVQKCMNITGVSWTCYPQTDIDTFMNTYLLKSDYFEVNIFMVDTLFSPLKSVYLTKNLEQQIFLSFSTNTGSRGTIKIGDYNVTTDHSIWPVEDTTEEIGHYIADYSTHTIQLFSTHYVKMVIEKDQTVYTIQRQHGKFDQMLSYVGGLFSLLFAFIIFFIGSYSEYKYEIAVAESAFVLDSTGRKVRDENFGFFTFIKYSIYDWLDSLGCTIKWKRMETIHKAREEATQQLDVRLLIKKMERFERINEILLNQRNLICAQLTEPPTLEKIKKLRKITQYYDKVIKEGDEQEPVLKESAVNPNSDAGFNQTVEDMRDENLQEQSKEEENNSDFDSEDQQVEKDIWEAFKTLKQEKESEEGSTLSIQIYNSIPKSMKKRLLRLSNKSIPIEPVTNNHVSPSKQISNNEKKRNKNAEFVLQDFNLD